MSISRLLQPSILLVLICTFFIFTRLYKISEIPSAVYWDEASIGYNAYSMIQTGKDEWGKVLPIHFRAFGEFKLPVFIYATVPSVMIFGLNAFSVRLPAVLFSLGVVILTYFLAKKLSGSSKVGLLSSFFISTSDWFFIFSRTGYEATAGLMFYLLAIYLSLEFDRQPRYIIFSTVSFILSAYSYNSFRVIIPLTILILIVFNVKNLAAILKRNIFSVIFSSIILVLSIIPIYRLYTLDAGVSRLQAVGSTNSAFIKNYFSHFSPDFLILRGDKNLRSQQSGFGQLYFPDMILLPLGLLYIVRSRSKYQLLSLILLLLGPIPAAITKESPHALRAISMVPFISIVSAMGVIYAKKYFRWRYVIEAGIVIIFLALFINYFINFLNVYPVLSSKDWQYGYKRIFTDYKDEFPKFDRVIISDEYAQPYIFALFYLKYDPDKFGQAVKRNSVDQWGFSTVSGFDKFEFGKVDRLLDIKSGHSLIFATNDEKKLNLTFPKTIQFLDDSKAFWVYEQ